MDKEHHQLHQEISDLTEQVKGYERSMVELKQRSDIQDTLNEMLNISLMHVSLQEQMERILLLILNIPWLALDKKGCVFLTDDTGEELDMIAYHNLGESLLGMCNHIKFGQCLCGRAAVSQELIFRNCIDDDHDIRPEGMLPHGHYNMPIISDGKTLGILNLYVTHGHQQTTLEKDFLEASAKAMASIIERKKIEEKLHKLSYMDELTGIANRRHFMNHLDEVILHSEKKQHLFAVLFIDLDHFKAINDTYGHEYGDGILVDATQRMLGCIRETDIAARLGGDEFVIILEMLSSSHKAVDIANKLIHSLSKPYEVLDKNLSIGASIGISVYPEHGTISEVLLRNADAALYIAKEKRGNSVLYIQN